MSFITLIKPGLIFGNLVTLCSGFFLATNQCETWSFFLFINLVFAMTLVFASGCVINNCIDHDIDRIMERTKNRPTASGLVSTAIYLKYGIAIGILGLLLLFFFVSYLSAFLAAFGLFVYVVLYTIFLKRSSVFSTVIGAVAGSVAPVIGYVSLVNYLDLIALTLFIIVFFWQIPHFFSIVLCRERDYRAINIPLFPLVYGIFYTKVSALLSIFLYLLSIMILSFIVHLNVLSLLFAVFLGLLWSALAIYGFFIETYILQWARKMFIFSIVNIFCLSFALAL